MKSSSAISGFVFLALITAVYSFKKKYNNLQDIIYRFLLSTTMILLVLEFVCIYTIKCSVEYGQLVIFNELLCRIYILIYIVLFIGIIGYVRSLANNKVYQKTWI